MDEEKNDFLTPIFIIFSIIILFLIDFLKSPILALNNRFSLFYELILFMLLINYFVYLCLRFIELGIMLWKQKNWEEQKFILIRGLKTNLYLVIPFLIYVIFLYLMYLNIIDSFVFLELIPESWHHYLYGFIEFCVYFSLGFVGLSTYAILKDRNYEFIEITFIKSPYFFLIFLILMGISSIYITKMPGNSVYGSNSGIQCGPIFVDHVSQSYFITENSIINCNINNNKSKFSENTTIEFFSPDSQENIILVNLETNVSRMNFSVENLQIGRYKLEIKNNNYTLEVGGLGPKDSRLYIVSRSEIIKKTEEIEYSKIGVLFGLFFILAYIIQYVWRKEN